MPPAVIVRLPNWLGDTVMAVPAIRALTAHWPDARVLLAGPWASVLAGQGLAEVLVDYPRRWTGRLAMADAVRRFGGEMALLLPNSFEAALAARYWGARRLVGFAGNARSWLLTDALPLPVPRLHQIDEYCLLVSRLGIETVDRAPALTPPGPDAEPRAQVHALLADAGAAPSGPRPIVGVHLGAAYGPSKVWPADRVAQLCRRLAADGAVPVLLGAPNDAAEAEGIARTTRARSLVGRDTPALLPALLAELDVLVSGDTGVAHLAAALGTAVVTLFGPTDPAVSAPRGRTAVVHHPVPCAPCAYRACPIDHPCMRAITVDEVRGQVRALAVAAR